MICCPIGLHDAHLPRAGKLPPDTMGKGGADSGSAANSRNEKFGNVPDERFAADMRSFFDKGETGELTIDAEKKGMPIWVLPVGMQIGIAESARFVQPHWEKFAEVVNIKFEQIREHRLLLHRGQYKFKLRKGPRWR